MKETRTDSDYVELMISNCMGRIEVVEDSMKLVPSEISSSWAFVNLGYEDKLLSLKKELEKWNNHESRKY